MHGLTPGASTALSERAPATATATNKSWRAHLAAVILLLASALFMAGCGDIMVTDRNVPAPPIAAQRSSFVTEGPVTGEVHDLAIAGVDFDPALNMNTILAGRRYSLLVAVENRGNRMETNFSVTAQLLTQDRMQVLVSSQRTVQMLAAGDIIVVRFPIESAPPRQRAYVLSTQVQAVPRESVVINNARLLDIQVNTAN